MKIFSRPPMEAVKALLAEAELPASDLTVEHLEHFFGCGTPERPRGIVGLEIYGSIALLRSLVVSEQLRGRGCGTLLVEKAEQYALSKGVHEIYLLTTTAERFFERLGYEPRLRDIAPDPIRQTAEFSELCPSTSSFMMKRLSQLSRSRVIVR